MFHLPDVSLVVFGYSPLFLILADFTYDTPEEVAEAFGSSLKTTLTLHEESGTVRLHKSQFHFHFSK